MDMKYMYIYGGKVTHLSSWFFCVLVYTILLGGNRGGGAFSDLLSKSKTLERT